MRFLFNTSKVLFPHVHDFEGPLNGLKGVTLHSPATSKVIGSGENHFLRFDNTGLTGLSTATFETLNALPKSFILQGELSSASGANRWTTGFLIFDYKSQDDFKYAGMFAGQNQWVIGHYQGDFSNRLVQVDWDDTGRKIKSNQTYKLELQIFGPGVRLLVDGEVIADADFGMKLNAGKTGVASYNALSRFDNLKTAEYGPLELAYFEDFDSDNTTQFQYNDPTKVSVKYLGEEGFLEVDTSGQNGLGVALYQIQRPLVAKWLVETDLTALSGPNRWQDGFIIFDYKSDTDFKYAGMLAGQNQWVVGQYQGSWNHLLIVDGDDYGWEIYPNVKYHFAVQAVRGVASFYVNHIKIGDVDYGSTLNTGMTGLGAYNGVTRFDNFKYSTVEGSDLLTGFPYYHDFDDGTLGLFETVPASSWKVLPHAGSKSLYFQNVGNGSRGVALLPEGSKYPSAYDVSVDLTVLDEEGGVGGIIIDYEDSRNFKYIYLGVPSGGLGIAEMRNGRIQGIADFSVRMLGRGFTVGANYSVHLSKNGNEITLTIDQEELFTYTFEEGALDNERLGLYAFGDAVAFDNFKLDQQINPAGLFKPNYNYTLQSSLQFNLQEGFELSNDEEIYLSTSKSRGLHLDGTENSSLTTALIPMPPNFPTSFEMSVKLAAVDEPGNWQDGLLVFDYQNPNDFKYAGMLAGQNQWVIGHYKNGFGNRLLSVDWDDQGRQINSGEFYLMHLDIDGGQVEMRVNAELIGTATFNTPIHDGQLGLATYNAHTYFRDLFIAEKVSQGDAIDVSQLSEEIKAEDISLLLLNEESIDYFKYLSYENSTDVRTPYDLGAVLTPNDLPYPSEYYAAVDVLFRSGNPSGYSENGYLIFDYRNENDFKYVGGLPAEDEWVIGHYQGDFDNRLALIDLDEIEGREIKFDWYQLEIFVDGAHVQFYVDGEQMLDATFDEPVNMGKVGFAAYETRTVFDNFRIGPLPQSAMAVDSLFSNIEEEGSALLI
ncbi:MAG: hypothetical protein R3C11_06770 [Planctomycetaceae bacterium]